MTITALRSPDAPRPGHPGPAGILGRDANFPEATVGVASIAGQRSTGYPCSASFLAGATAAQATTAARRQHFGSTSVGVDVIPARPPPRPVRTDHRTPVGVILGAQPKGVAPPGASSVPLWWTSMPPCRPVSSASAACSGYADAHLQTQQPERTRLRLGRATSQLAELRERFRAVAADPLVRAHCPHVACNPADVTAVAVAVVVDMLVLCPDLFADPAMARFIEEAPAAQDANMLHEQRLVPDLLAFLGSLTAAAGSSLPALGGLLTQPLVAEVLAPLLVQALNLVVPGLGLALAPVLPVAFPIAGRLMAGAGQGGGGAAPDLTVILDALVAFGGAVPGSVATPAGVV